MKLKLVFAALRKFRGCVLQANFINIKISSKWESKEHMKTVSLGERG